MFTKSFLLRSQEEFEAAMIMAVRKPEGSWLADADWIEEVEYEEVYRRHMNVLQRFLLRKMVAKHRAVRAALRKAIDPRFQEAAQRTLQGGHGPEVVCVPYKS